MSDQNRIIERPSRTSAEASSTPDGQKRKRGFAAMNPVEVRELARRGGVAAHRAGTAHEFSPDEARSAGRKGALARLGRTRQARDESKDLTN